MVHSLSFAELEGEGPQEPSWIDKIFKLKDLIPTPWRHNLWTAAKALGGGLQTGFAYACRAAWIITTGVLILYLPLYSALDQEALMLQQLEAELVQAKAFAGGAGNLNLPGFENDLELAIK
jgi:hypothetical protein